MSFTIHADDSLADCWLDRGEGSQGISHPELCRGGWPAAVLAEIRRIGGPGDIQVENISGSALNEQALARQMAERPGWVRLMGFAAWHMVDQRGISQSCQGRTFPGLTLVQDDWCKSALAPFAPLIGADGKPRATDFGRHSAYYVKEAASD